jgi:hypothetical protein
MDGGKVWNFGGMTVDRVKPPEPMQGHYGCRSIEFTMTNRRMIKDT